MLIKAAPPLGLLKGPAADDTRSDGQQDGIAMLSLDPINEEEGHGASTALKCHDGNESQPQTKLRGLRELYHRNFGLFLFFLGQVFGSIMQVAAKMLATGSEPRLHPPQIILARMIFTGAFGFIYMWIRKVPNAPFGPREVRGLLALRGFAGFIGYVGLLYSLIFLDMSDAVALSFVIPVLTALVSWAALREPFTLREFLAGLIAFAGVLLVARPSFLFAHATSVPSDSSSAAQLPREQAAGDSGVVQPGQPPLESEAQRALAVICAVIGAFGAAVAFTTIRAIGKRAHSLISVNYFAMTSVVGSTVVILAHPDLHLEIPRGREQWTLLLIVGVTGFLLQVLLSEGLQREKAGRATNIIYINLVFAMIFDKIIWGTTPAPLSLLGCALIIGAAIWVTMQKSEPSVKQGKGQLDEEEILLESV